MEELLGIIVAVCVVVWLLYLLVEYVIMPIASVLLTVIAVVSMGYALFVSLHSFISAFRENLNPYKTYVDNHADATQGIKRNYCFGPGFHQISQIVSGAFKNLADYRIKLKAWKDKAIRHSWIIDMWIYIGYGLAIFCAQVLGCIWVGVFSFILATGIIIGMIGFFLFFSILWLSDRTVLIKNSIHTRCPNCKRKSVVPTFECPTCGLEHKNLVPGPYGVMKRKCSCDTILATTFIGGRSQYKAHCPFCDTELFSSGSQHYGIQLVGGIGAGKTTFLAAFWHEYRAWLNRLQGISYEETPSEAFEILDEWFESGAAEATTETNASMYSILHSTGKNTSIQMTVYDIAGEVFNFSEADLQQQQFRYCEGFLLVIDPTASANYVSETIGNFINSLDEIMGKHATKSAAVPVAAIITKSDLYKREIGLPRIRATYKSAEASASEPYAYADHLNNVCRTFLLEHGFDNAVNLIEAEFSNIRYFPVSAMGHSMEDGQYEPWGVLDPVFWLMGHENCPLREIVTQS